MALSSEITFDCLLPEEVETAVEIEKEGYPADEAGSLESFRFRQTNAGSLFLGAYRATGDSRQLIGYVCSTLSPDEKLTHESMSNHVPASESVCIHSICVAKPYRRTGVGLRLMREYLARLSSAQAAGMPYKRVLLIAHNELRQFYEKAGFTWVGKSDVTHGSRPWYEMRMVLGSEIPRPTPPAMQDSVGSEGIQLPSDVLQNLLRPSIEKHTPTFVSDYHHGLDDLILKDEGDTGLAVNKYDILCPRGCRSVILKKGRAQWAERTSVTMEPEDLRESLLPALPPPPETAQWWLVKSFMTFENIGFSRPAGTLSTGKRLQLLVCAECDLGPLGWCEQGGSESWLAASRVGYRNL